MNGYLRAAFAVPNAVLKLSLLKIFHLKRLTFGNLPRISLFTELTVENGAMLHIGNRFNMRSGSKVRIRNKGQLCFGDNVSISHNCIITCREKIVIGSDVQFAPGVLVYDHDHDYCAEGGIKAGKYKTEPIVIGNNVWVGANAIILRGAKIGDNAVIAAGTVVRRGQYSPDSLIYHKREISVKKKDNV